jgi:hypothetical protein
MNVSYSDVLVLFLAGGVLGFSLGDLLAKRRKHRGQATPASGAERGFLQFLRRKGELLILLPVLAIFWLLVEGPSPDGFRSFGEWCFAWIAVYSFGLPLWYLLERQRLKRGRREVDREP